MPHDRSSATGAVCPFQTRAFQTLFSSIATGVTLLAAEPAMAAGTLAGAEITASATVDYSIGSVAQTSISSSDKIIVDRKINPFINYLGGTSPVTPGQTGVLQTISFTNAGNAPVTFVPSLAQGTGKSASHQGFKLYADTNGNGIYDSGADTTIVGTLAGTSGAAFVLNSQATLPVTQPDTETVYHVVLDVSKDTTIVNGDTLFFVAGANVHEPNTAGNQVTTKIAATSGANTAGMDTVLADGTYGLTGDVAGDGKIFRNIGFIITAASLNVVRATKLVSDPVNGTTNPKAIPGAVVEYCLQLTNATGSTTVSNVTVVDTPPGSVTYDSAYGIYQGGTVTSGACNADGAKVTTFAGGKATGVVSSLSAGATATVRYRATVN